MHVPLAQQQDELRLGERRVDVRQRHAVEGQVPGREPGVLPRVGHQDDLVVVQVRPVAVADVAATGRRRRLRGIAGEPPLHVVVEELLAPQQSGERLPGHHRLGGRGGRGNHGGVERVRLLLAGRDDGVELLAERRSARCSVPAGRRRWPGAARPTIRTLMVVDPPAGTVTGSAARPWCPRQAG